jgi:glycosyltransferase involved in cell wall biosynthesis
VKLVFVTQVLDADDAVLGFVIRWIQGLAKHCEQVRVLALEVGSTEGLPDNVDYRVIGRKGRLRRWLRYRGQLSEALGKDSFDTLLTHMVPRYSVVAAGPVRKHGVGHFLWYTHKGVDSRLKNAVKVVEKVFTAGAESMRIETAKKVVTGHGIDVQHFDPKDANPVVPARLLSVGRLTPAKDPLTLLAAFSILVSRGHDVHLDWVGAGLAAGDEAFRRTVEEQIEYGGPGLEERVHLIGDVPYPEIPGWFRRSTVFVSTSLTGSIDKVVLEAMSCARPVVTCNESFPPIFAALGEDADKLVFEQGNAEQLAERLELLLTWKPAGRHLLGERLREIVTSGHEVDQLMGRLVAAMGERT